MDRVGLGRALGYGARHAAKTLEAVAKAATAPDRRQSPGARAPKPQEVSRKEQVRRLPRAVRGAGRSAWAPLRTYSSALWLRVTGLFFAMVALAMANGAWRLHAAARAQGADLVAARHFWLFTGFALLFGYFAVTGFLRARKCEQRGIRR